MPTPTETKSFPTYLDEQQTQAAPDRAVPLAGSVDATDAGIQKVPQANIHSGKADELDDGAGNTATASQASTAYLHSQQTVPHTTQDQHDALTAANAPSNANPIATIADVSNSHVGFDRNYAFSSSVVGTVASGVFRLNALQATATSAVFSTTDADGGDATPIVGNLTAGGRVVIASGADLVRYAVTGDSVAGTGEYSVPVAFIDADFSLVNTTEYVCFFTVGTDPSSDTMLKSVYDPDDNAIVDKAESLEGPAGQNISTAAEVESHRTSTVLHLTSDEHDALTAADNPSGTNPITVTSDVTAAKLELLDKATYDADDDGLVDASEQLEGPAPTQNIVTASQARSHIDSTALHLSTDERAALDNSPNTPDGANPLATQADIASAGGGDMLKATYDADDDQIVDRAEQLEGPALSDNISTALDVFSHRTSASVHLSSDERAAFDNAPTPATGANPLVTTDDLPPSSGVQERVYQVTVANHIASESDFRDSTGTTPGIWINFDGVGLDYHVTTAMTLQDGDSVVIQARGDQVTISTGAGVTVIPSQGGTLAIKTGSAAMLLRDSISNTYSLIGGLVPA